MPVAATSNYPFTDGPRRCGQEQSSRKRVVISRLKSSRQAEDDGKKNRANLLGGPRTLFLRPGLPGHSRRARQTEAFVFRPVFSSFSFRDEFSNDSRANAVAYISV